MGIYQARSAANAFSHSIASSSSSSIPSGGARVQSSTQCIQKKVQIKRTDCPRAETNHRDKCFRISFKNINKAFVFSTTIRPSYLFKWWFLFLSSRCVASDYALRSHRRMPCVKWLSPPPLLLLLLLLLLSNFKHLLHTNSFRVERAGGTKDEFKATHKRRNEHLIGSCFLLSRWTRSINLLLKRCASTHRKARNNNNKNDRTSARTEKKSRERDTQQ